MGDPQPPWLRGSPVGWPRPPTRSCALREAWPWPPPHPARSTTPPQGLGPTSPLTPRPPGSLRGFVVPPWHSCPSLPGRCSSVCVPFGVSCVFLVMSGPQRGLGPAPLVVFGCSPCLVSPPEIKAALRKSLGAPRVLGDSSGAWGHSGDRPCSFQSAGTASPGSPWAQPAPARLPSAPPGGEILPVLSLRWVGKAMPAG